MSAEEYVASAHAEVTIHISGDAPDDLFTRMAEGELPQSLYGRMDQVAVLEHWVHNAIRNGVLDVSDLDGWADVQRGLVRFDVNHVEGFELVLAGTAA